jgi:hypothetical protein
VQRKRTSSEAAKEKAPNHLSGIAGYPPLLESARRCETRGVYTPLRGAQTVLALFLADSAMLGCVKWGLKDGVTKLSQFFINNNG